MKTKNNLIVLVLGSLFLFSALLYPAESVNSDSDTLAIITKLVLDVNYSTSGDDEWKKAEILIRLKENYKLKTEDRSLAVVSFLDGTILRVRANSELIISGKKIGKAINKETHVDKGGVNFEVKDQGDASFKFTTPTAVASIRGTEGNLDVGDDGSTICIVTNGQVDIEALLGQQQTGSVGAGYTASISNDGEVIIYESTEEEKNAVEAGKKENVKILEIKTKDGESVIIKYYGD